MGDAHPKRGHLAEQSVVHRLFGVEDLGDRPARKRNAKLDAVRPHRGGDRLAIGYVGREHFLREDVLAGVRRANHHVAVQVCRGDDADGIDVVARQQGVEVRLERNIEFFGPGRTASRILIPDRHHVGVGIGADFPGVLVGVDVPSTQHGDMQHGT